MGGRDGENNKRRMIKLCTHIKLFFMNNNKKILFRATEDVKLLFG